MFQIWQHQILQHGFLTHMLNPAAQKIHTIRTDSVISEWLTELGLKIYLLGHSDKYLTIKF